MNDIIYTNIKLKDAITIIDPNKISLDGIKIKDVSFKNTLSYNKEDNLKNYIFEDCTFISCIFNNIETNNVSFVNCEFLHSAFIDVNIKDNIFINCNFRDCNFARLNLEKINITLCNFKDNKFYKIKSQENIYISTSNFE